VASCDKPQTWSTYRHVCYARRRLRSDGIGFVFTTKDPFCGIDLDRCRALNGKIESEAQTVIERLASYTELSPSGTGIHVLVKAKLGGPGRRSGKVEIYDSGRYLTVTGQQESQNGGYVENRQVQLDNLISEIFSRGDIALSSTNSATLFASDEQFTKRAKAARNGDRFGRLWAGDTSDSGVIIAASTLLSAECCRSGARAISTMSISCSGNPD